MTRIRRRALLAGASLAAIAPTLWLRRSRAAGSAHGLAQHAIVLYAKGGLRSHCLFNAVGTAQYNPHGVLAGAGSAWAAGAVLGDADIATSSFDAVPGFHAIARHTCVFASVDIAPELDRPLIDHDPAVLRLGVGVEGSDQGLLSRLLQSHPRYATGIGPGNLPPVDIGNTVFGKTSTPAVPLRIPSATAKVPRTPIARDWAARRRTELDARFAARTPGAYADRVARLGQARTSAYEFSSVLVDPRLAVLDQPDAGADGFTNAQLLEVLGDYDFVDVGDRDSNRSWGPDVALAIRLVTLGTAMVVAQRDIYDTHSEEDASLPLRAADLGRQLAGLRFILGKMAHPDGGTYWDRTIVTVVSEFNRNNTDPQTGYNSGNGSDHVLVDADVTRVQAVPLLGGPIEALGLGGKRIGATDDRLVAIDGITSMRSVYSTLFELLGASHTDHWPDAPTPEVLA